ncbi:MAG TPA: VCBS repeat-containing protein [Nitrospirota bacterium]
MKRYLAAAVAAVCVALWHPVAYAATPPNYAKSALKFAGKLVNLAAGDMDGDGLKDIAAVSLTGEPGKKQGRVVEIFLQKKTGGFAAKPDMSWQAARDAVVFDVGDVSGTGRSSFCYIAPDGMYAYLPSATGYDTKPARLISRAGVFAKPDPLDMPRWPFLVPDGGGKPELALIPGISTLGVFRKGGRGYEQVVGALLPVDTTYSGGPRAGADSSLTVSHRIPAVEAAGYNSRGNPDIVMTLDDNALVYLRGKDGGYRKTPDVSFRPGLYRRPGKGPLEGAWVEPADLDGDGRLDFTVIKKEGGMAHSKSLIFVYMRRPDGSLPAKPGATIITEGVVGPRFMDIDGDGRLDLLLPSVKVGISNVVNILTSGQVNVDVDIYIQGKDGGFLDRPTRSKVIGFKLDLTNLTRAAPVMETGKFTRDKGSGLVVVSRDGLVSIYLPDRYSLISDRPGLDIKVESPTEMDVSDMNGDGIDDIVMTYRKSDKSAGTANVFLSR